MIEYVPDNYDQWLQYDTESEKKWNKMLKEEKEKREINKGSDSNGN